MINIGVTGQGVARRLHAPVLGALPGVKVHWIRLPRVSPEGQALDLGLDIDEIEGLNLGCVGTPPFAHEPHVLSLLRAGVPVLCEKPAGVDPATPRRLRSISEELGIPVSVNYQLRFHPTVQQLKADLQARTPLSLRIIYHSSAARIDQRAAWFDHPRAGGGVDSSIGSHLFDLVAFLRSPLSSIACEGETCCRGGRGHDHRVRFSATGGTACGDEVMIEVDVARAHARFTVEVRHEALALEADLIGSEIRSVSEAARRQVRYSPGLLQSDARSPWRLGFELAAQTMLRTATAIDLSKGATLIDAEGALVLLHELRRE